MITSDNQSHTHRLTNRAYPHMHDIQTENGTGRELKFMAFLDWLLKIQHGGEKIVQCGTRPSPLMPHYLPSILWKFFYVSSL
jgi:hypothetical protein